MADFLGGLLSGGGGLYDDLLTPQQQSQLSSRGLLSMAGAFADAAMPSRFPVPLGAAIGKAAAAMSGGRDEAALKLLQGQKLSQEVQSLKARAAIEQQMMDDLRKLPLDVLVQRLHGGGGASTVAPSVMPGAAPAAAPAMPAAPPPAATPGAVPPDAAPDGATLPSIIPPRRDLSRYGFGSGAGLLGGDPSQAAAVEPPSPGAPDTVLPSPDGVYNRYSPAEKAAIAQRFRPQAGLLDGGGAGAPPFGDGGAALPVRLANATLAPYAAGNAVMGGPSSVAGVSDVMSQKINDMVAKMPPDIAARFKIISGYRDTDRQMQVNPSAPNSRHGAGTGPPGTGMAVDIAKDREVINWITQNQAELGLGFPLAAKDPREINHMEMVNAQGERLPPGGDVVIPSGRGLPPNMLQQVADKGGAPGAPTPPVPPGVDPQAMNALLMELAKRNAMAEIVKLGNPYSSMLSVLQGSPAYKAQIETATRGAGLPFVGPEEAARKGAAYPFEAAMEAFKTQNQAFLKDKEQLGAAALDPAPNGILVPDPAGGMKRVQATKLQAAAAARGLGVPELGIPPMLKPPAGATGPTVSPVGEPVLTPGQIKTQETAATHTQARLNNYREAADAAANAKTTLQGISGEIGKVVTGPFADYAQNAALYLNTIAPGFSGQVKAYEDMASQANELVRKAVRASDPNPSFVQTRMAMDSMPIPSKSEGGLYKITNRMIGLQDHDIARGNATQMETPGGAEKFDSWWRQNVSPYAFVFAKLAPDDRDSLISTLQKTAQGKRELETIGKQLQFIEQHGGFGVR